MGQLLKITGAKTVRQWPSVTPEVRKALELKGDNWEPECQPGVGVETKKYPLAW